MQFLRTIMLACALIGVAWRSESQPNPFDNDSMMIQGQGVNISFCNRTTKTPVIFVATGSNLNDDPEGARVWVRGWWRVERGKCVNTGRHSVGKGWFYGQTAGGARTFVGSNLPGDVLCVKDDERFNTVVTADDMTGRPICPNDYRIQQFGSFETYPSDVRNGFFVPFVD